MNVRLRQGGYAAYGELKCTHRFLGIGRWFGAVSLMLMFSACIDENSPNQEDVEASDASVPDATPLGDGRVIEFVDVGVRPDSATADMERPRVVDPCDAPLSGDDEWELSLASQPAQHSGSCGGGGNEAVIEFVAPSAGYWRFSTAHPATGNIDTVLYIRRVCTEPGTEIGCNDDGGDLTTSRLGVELEEGETIFVFVDVWDGQPGRVRVTAEQIQPGGVGDQCDGVRPCDEELVCFRSRRDDFGDSAGICSEVRERAEGEECDPRGETGLCSDGLICLRTMGRRSGICTRPQVVGEGEACDVERSVLLCDEGFLAQKSVWRSFCLPISREEGAICDPRMSLDHVADLLCFVQEEAPRDVIKRRQNVQTGGWCRRFISSQV